MKTERITTKWLQSLVAQYGNDFAYARAVERLGLYGIAFFGHKAKPSERRKLTSIWNRILKV